MAFVVGLHAGNKVHRPPGTRQIVSVLGIGYTHLQVLTSRHAKWSPNVLGCRWLGTTSWTTLSSQPSCGQVKFRLLALSPLIGIAAPCFESLLVEMARKSGMLAGNPSPTTARRHTGAPNLLPSRPTRESAIRDVIMIPLQGSSRPGAALRRRVGPRCLFASRARCTYTTPAFSASQTLPP